MLLAAAGAVAVVHGAAVLFMLTGALLALRWPRLLLLQAPVALTILGFHLAGGDCPLTTLELWLRARAGVAAYRGGFLGHYLFGPLDLDVTSTPVQAGVFTVALALNALGYGLLAVRRLRGRRSSAASPSRTAAGRGVSSGSQR